MYIFDLPPPPTSLQSRLHLTFLFPFPTPAVHLGFAWKHRTYKPQLWSSLQDLAIFVTVGPCTMGSMMLANLGQATVGQALQFTLCPVIMLLFLCPLKIYTLFSSTPPTPHTALSPYPKGLSAPIVGLQTRPSNLSPLISSQHFPPIPMHSDWSSESFILIVDTCRDWYLM